MTNVVDLGGKSIKKHEAHQGMIEMLEHYLEMAKQGDLRALGIIAVDRESRVYTKARNIDAKHELVAACLYLQHDICSESK